MFLFTQSAKICRNLVIQGNVTSQESIYITNVFVILCSAELLALHLKLHVSEFLYEHDQATLL